MYKVAAFDLWDTLAYLKDLQIVRQQFKEALGEEKYATYLSHFKAIHATEVTTEDFFERLAEDMEISPDHEPIIERLLNYDNVVLFPDAREVLNFLREKNKKLILISNCISSTRWQIERLGLVDYFDKIVLSCSVGLRKPDRAIFELAIQDFDVKPNEVVMIGDQVKLDMEGAKALGWDAILLDRENKKDYDGKKIRSLLELKEIIA